MNLDICLASDSNYIKYMATTIVSILKNTTDTDNIIFHIIDGGFSDDEKKQLLKLQNIRDFTIHYYTPNIEMYEKWFKEKVKKKYHFSAATFYRLSIPSLIKDVDKILYLDSDLVAIKNIRKVFEIDIENYYAMVVDNSIQRINSNYEKEYFNAGFIMINNKLWREKQLEAQFFEYYEHNYEKCIWLDQDVLNAVLKGKVKYLENTYMLFASKVFNHNDIDMDKVVTVHYNTSLKPWGKRASEKNTLFLNKYWEYYKYIPWFQDDILETIDIITDQKINSAKMDIDQKINSTKIRILNQITTLVNEIAWWIPVKKWREAFRDKFRKL